ncbi:Omp28-related outer membrane protein [Mangrovimonas sp. DI 80]|uniref:Omp28-related outer membrane protein n=1 Tax=Mangrovimonas sp. DI 80 TaxID=1779330 RepID=UPI000978CFA4|nr:Omp28-related outer membrane protein [Mangrovimonas sp. DI 80]OMP31745.1 hypothetical protein BKM32_01390 [Mangrovimonas sp. DI 80]
MKTTRLLQLFLLVVSSAFFSCSSSDDGGEGQGQASAITISVDNNAINLGQSVTFTVTDDQNANVTSEATIYFSGTAISESTYTPTQAGSFVVNAKLGGVTSNNISVTVSSLVISASKTSVFPGETITLTATGNLGNDLTSEATFFVNGVEISGNSYTTSEFRGIDQVTATHGTLESNVKSILKGYSQKVLVEDYTGTWCGWCPRVAYGIELVEDATDNAVIAAIHRGPNGYDPFNYPAGDLESKLGIKSYPAAMLNRTTEWNTPEPSYVNQVVGLTQSVSPTAIALSSALNGTTLDVNVSMDILDETLGAKLVIYVLEDGLVAEQTNYTDYYGGADYLSDFVHDNVLRQVPTGLFGENITESDLDGNTNLYVKNYSFQLDSSIADTSKIHLVVFVTDISGKALNVVGSQIGEKIVIED